MGIILFLKKKKITRKIKLCEEHSFKLKTNLESHP
jgi:hypothetical protein